ncbi:hypothetical protein A9X84_08850 [Brachyspira hyodysenteriae]|uniref:Uncharacterized protein n=1 Tax=Brachyspira hyodysenteriae (strain ATCC 49526 / WA1) TaxID=565034 RepID=A0A3B6VBK6_BRAHW|nr:hypothetical protein [Brachyspira hyodysenteriae]ACN83977.1 hypothetical protein BHWA1_01507 [Brachyspira hyodysenteriae WA1]KLI16240.1 hypothetical protein SU45_08195 [Brachyspira hyodysenteriae]KLI45222.1 hypothetical protein SZ40_06825 [Brachyspira hyodysenteriae]KLI55302.1 hypothetical protein SZ45_09210 [Brachyspira hyodysenteriae]KLI57428.1 hypothetical protein SZ46_11445 [Brachyspira hyodysenteriae]
MKISILAVVVIIVSFIFYTEMTKHNDNVYNVNVIEEIEENKIYNGNYIVSDNNIILENSYDFNSNIEIKEIRRNYLRWRDKEHPNVDFEEDSKDLYVRLIIIFMMGCAIIGVLIEILFFKNASYKFYIILLTIILVISSVIIYKIHENLAIFNMAGSIESVLELLAFFIGGVISFVGLLISKYLRYKDNKKNNE